MKLFIYRKHLLIGAVLFCLAWMPAQAVDNALEEVMVGRVPYVTLESFCKKYSLDSPKETQKDIFESQNASGKRKWLFQIDSRECFYNEVLYWLSLPVLKKDDQALISKIDANKLLSPIMSPQNVGPKMLILGVIIDPGHGGNNDGTIARNGLKEKDVNLEVARQLREELRRDGIPSVMTRDSDVFLSLEERAKFTDRYPAYIFVSIHHNEGSSASRGVETFCLTPEYTSSTNDENSRYAKTLLPSRGNFYDTANVVLASYVHREMVKLHPSESDRGVKRARFGVLRRARAPAILVECGFMSNNGDLSLIQSQKYRAKVAENIGAAIKRFVETMNSNPSSKRRSDRSVNFAARTTVPPLRKAEFVPASSQQELCGARIVFADEKDQKIDPHEPEDGRGLKESIPADDIQTLLKSKVEDIMKKEREVSAKNQTSTRR